eukprot:gb/GECG01007405.1/.p1 GENE.gb/GECG01007405.1/~~gb/GECG01007405.1/.p1  ORF type:complete len:713 (+),score=115.04 gb/GECG01007405.1/:1-2139(+)
MSSSAPGTPAGPNDNDAHTKSKEDDRESVGSSSSRTSSDGSSTAYSSDNEEQQTPQNASRTANSSQQQHSVDKSQTTQSVHRPTTTNSAALNRPVNNGKRPREDSSSGSSTQSGSGDSSSGSETESDTEEDDQHVQIQQQRQPGGNAWQPSAQAAAQKAHATNTSPPALVQTASNAAGKAAYAQPQGAQLKNDYRQAQGLAQQSHRKIAPGWHPPMPPSMQPSWASQAPQVAVSSHVLSLNDYKDDPQLKVVRNVELEKEGQAMNAGDIPSADHQDKVVSVYATAYSASCPADSSPIQSSIQTSSSSPQNTHGSATMGSDNHDGSQRSNFHTSRRFYFRPYNLTNPPAFLLDATLKDVHSLQDSLQQRILESLSAYHSSRSVKVGPQKAPENHDRYSRATGASTAWPPLYSQYAPTNKDSKGGSAQQKTSASMNDREEECVALYNGFGTEEGSAEFNDTGETAVQKAQNEGVISPFAILHTDSKFLLRWEVSLEYRGWMFHLGAYRSYDEARLIFETGLATIISALLGKRIEVEDCTSVLYKSRRVLSGNSRAAAMVGSRLPVCGGLFGRRVRRHGAPSTVEPESTRSRKQGRSAGTKAKNHAVVGGSPQQKKGAKASSPKSGKNSSTLPLPKKSGVHSISGGAGRASFYRTVIKHEGEIQDLGLYAIKRNANEALRVAERILADGNSFKAVEEQLKELQSKDQQEANSEFA